MASSDDEGEDDDDEEEEITLAQKLAKSTNPLRTISYHPCFELGEVLGFACFALYVLLIYLPCWCFGKTARRWSDHKAARVSAANKKTAAIAAAAGEGMQISVVD